MALAIVGARLPTSARSRSNFKPQTLTVTLMVSKRAEPEPLIPSSFLDVPSQRLYVLSLGIVCQVSRAFHSVGARQPLSGYQSPRLLPLHG